MGIFVPPNFLPWVLNAYDGTLDNAWQSRGANDANHGYKTARQFSYREHVPAVATDCAIALPSTELYKIVGIYGIIVCDGTVANRSTQLTVTQDAGSAGTVLIATTAYNTTAGQYSIISMTEGKSWWSKNLNGTYSQVAGEGNLPLYGAGGNGHTINFTATNKQAADQLQLFAWFEAVGAP